VWGDIVGLGLAMALQPLPALASIVLLSVERGTLKASAFFLGVFTAMFLVGAAAVALKIGASHHSLGTRAAVLRLAAGAALLFFGTRFVLRSRSGTAAAEPGWLGRLDRMDPFPAFLLGTFLPTYLIAVAVGAHIVEAQISTSKAVVALLVFVTIGASTVYVPILLAKFAPAKSGPVRARVRDWLVSNWVGVAGTLLFLVGGFLVAQAAIVLAR
jgi:hypothetical protein